MYREFFGFSEKPFNLTPDPDFLYLSGSHRDALAHLAYGVESKSGFVVVTGDVGAGKTTLLRTLIRDLGDNVLLSQVSNTRVTYKELLEMVLRDFGLDPATMGKTALLSALNDFLIQKYRAGVSCVLLIDEAQNLNTSTLEGVRMLSNLETEKAKLLHTILVGQPGLRDLIDSPELEQLRQRVSVRYHLGPLSPGETGEYIRHRLGKVAQDPEKLPDFPDEVLPAIHAATGGVPRLVNVLCDAALLHAYVAGTRVVSPQVLASAEEQVRVDRRRTAAEPRSSGETLSPVAEPLADRLSRLEARLDSLAEEVARARLAPEGQLTLREGALQEREAALDRRAAAVERRERELVERVSRLREQWRKRIVAVERLRRRGEEPEAAARFPTVSVHAFDPNPRLRGAIREALEPTGADVEVYDDFAGFLEGLRDVSRSGSFAVAVLGAVPDDVLNAERVAALAAALPQVPLLYLSDLDLLSVRRRILAAGANYFLDKPSAAEGNPFRRSEQLEAFRAELLAVVIRVESQQKALFKALLEPDLEAADAGREAGA